MVKGVIDDRSLLIELRSFEDHYLRTVGSRYAELDSIKARIAALRAQQNPTDTTAQAEAKAAQSRDAESEREAAGSRDTPEKPAFTPSDDLKKLYRSVAKRLHPYLATDDAERERRHHFMAEVNNAYELGDEDRLRDIAREWESSPEITPEGGLAAALVRLNPKIAQVRKRVEQTYKEIAALRDSAIHKLRERVNAATDVGRDLLSEMVVEIESEIAGLRVIMDRMEAEIAEGEGGAGD